MGPSSLELLEATAPDSPIARFVERRGPGLHHVALRVEDIDAALVYLASRGVRLIDTVARPGAEGARVAFIHPVRRPRRAGGIEAARAARCRGSGRRRATQLGDLELIQPVRRLLQPRWRGDVRRRAARPCGRRDCPPTIAIAFLSACGRSSCAATETLIIDAGCGDKMDAKSADIYGLDRRYHLDHALAEAGLSADDIDIVGRQPPALRSRGRLHPRAPMTAPGAALSAGALCRPSPGVGRRHASARAEPGQLPRGELRARCQDAGVLTLVDDGAEIMPGVPYRRSGGHTAHHQVVMIESGGATAVFAADMYPTSAHVPDPWVMGYDLYPMDTLCFKRAFAPGGRRARVSDLLRARSVAGGRHPARAGRQAAGGTRHSLGAFMSVQIGIIGGSGLYDMAELTDRDERLCHDAVRRSLGSVHRSARCAASAWPSSLATAPGTGCRRRS